MKEYLYRVRLIIWFRECVKLFPLDISTKNLNIQNIKF